MLASYESSQHCAGAVRDLYLQTSGFSTVLLWVWLQLVYDDPRNGVLKMMPPSLSPLEGEDQ